MTNPSSPPPNQLPWDLPAPEPMGGSRPSLVGLDLPAMRSFLSSLGEPAWRGGQLFEGIYRQRWATWDRFTAFGKDLRARLEAVADLSRPRIVESLPSDDGSTKHAFRLDDGQLIEGVHMPYHDVRWSDLRPTPPEPPRPGQAKPVPGALTRATLCLSSQVGCALGCTFCATGQMGILRNLVPAEIVGQVLAMLDHHGHPPGIPVNLVFMGMGEPMHNLDHVMAAFRVFSDPGGLAIPPRRITLSTAGLVSGIQRLGAFKPRPRLALSLNATSDEARSRIMPVNRVWGLDSLAEALRAFPLDRGERITLEFVLLKGVNDSLEDGQRLAAFARHFPCKINLIPFNSHEAGAGSGGPPAQRDGPEGAGQDGPRVGTGFEPPDESRVEALCALLSKAGLTVSVRRSRGQDVAGACGQLVRKKGRTSL